MDKLQIIYAACVIASNREFDWKQEKSNPNIDQVRKPTKPDSGT
jgi:hypothetical protein